MGLLGDNLCLAAAPQSALSGKHLRLSLSLKSSPLTSSMQTVAIGRVGPSFQASCGRANYQSVDRNHATVHCGITLWYS